VHFPVVIPTAVSLSPAFLAGALATEDTGELTRETLACAVALARNLGPAYRASPRSTVYADVVAWGAVLARQRLRQRAAADEAFLDTAFYLLAEWEAQLGLPTGEGLPVATRRQRLVAKWRSLRGGSPQAIASAITALLADGDAATVVENLATAVTTPAYVFVFAVVVPDSYFSDPSFAPRVLAIVAGQKPAHTLARVTNRVGFRCDDPDSRCDRTLLRV